MNTKNSPSPEDGYVLHPRLAADTALIRQLTLSEARIMRDARFPWVVLIPRRANVSELLDLKPHERDTLRSEIDTISAAMLRVFAPDKLNIAAIGNVVSQLHIHIVARYHTDAAWPAPVWGSGEAEAYSQSELDNAVQRVLAALTP